MHVKTKAAIQWAVAATVLSVGLPVPAYEVETHEILSRLAAQASQPYQDPNIFRKLGYPARELAIHVSPCAASPLQDFLGIVADGSKWEDDQPFVAGL